MAHVLTLIWPVLLGSSLRPLIALMIAAAAAALVVGLLVVTDKALARISDTPLPDAVEDVPPTAMVRQLPSRRVGCLTCLAVCVISVPLTFGGLWLWVYLTGELPGDVRFIGMCDRQPGPIVTSPGDRYEAWRVTGYCGDFMTVGDSFVEVRAGASHPNVWERFEWRGSRGDEVLRINANAWHDNGPAEPVVQLRWVTDRELRIICDGCGWDAPEVRHWNDVTVVLLPVSV